ncbi:uncharacterized protein [Ptychodera flava]|uniref:uncharacterized protein isoform X2 n=1 Tax=Ptychodera flava TaxID=63121 RepID=UPI00396A6A76
MDEITAFAKECADATEGNVVGWSAMFGGNAEREKTVGRQKDICSNGDCEDSDCMTEGACIYDPVGQCSCPSQTSCQSEGRKLQFDGSSRVDVNVNDRVTQIDSLSICMWLKISSSSGTLFSITTPTSTENNTIQNIEFLGFSLVVQTYGGNRHSWYSYLTLDPSKVTDNRWHHVCIVGELTGDLNTILRIYKDGMMITTPYLSQAVTMRGLETISLAGPRTHGVSPQRCTAFSFGVATSAVKARRSI